MKTFLIVILAFWTGTANAQSIQGSDSFEFEMAAMLWLDGVEEEALPAFVDLAESGNNAAMIMIALVEKMTETHSPWLATLGRGERIALLRQAEGMSGKSWMFAVTEEVLADSWIKLWNVDTGFETALEFARMGEARAARQTLYSIEERDIKGFATIADDPLYPEEMRYLVWLETGYTKVDLRSLHRGDPQRVILTGKEPSEHDLEDWLLSAEIATPVAGFCNRQCPDSVGSCARAAYSAVYGYTGLILFGSPSSSLISEADYASSVTGMAALLRRPGLLVKNERERNLDALANIDACFADRARAATSIFMP